MQQGLSYLGFVSRGPLQTRRFGEELGSAARPGDLILLDGPFGAGKTTLVQGLAGGIGARERVTSPSFTLINEYYGRIPLWHVDLFRLKRLDIEMEQALESCEEGDGVTVVEWPALMPEELVEGALRIEIQILGDTDRSLIVRAGGTRWDSLLVAPMMEMALRQPTGEGW